MSAADDIDAARDCIESIAAARLNLIASTGTGGRGRPYYSHVVFSFTIVPTPRVPTVAVDSKWRLYASPAWVARQEIAQLAAVLAHEANHVIRMHDVRAPAGVAAATWNVAADLEINDDLAADGLQLPPGGLFPADFGVPNNLTAEEYLEHVDDGRGNDEPHPATDQGRQGCATNLFDGPCGQGADGHTHEWELGDDLEQPGVSPATAAVIRITTAQAIDQHAKSGSVPGGLRRFADELLRPQVDWRRQLAGKTRGAIDSERGNTDYTYARPNRRRMDSDVIMPATIAPRPLAAVVVDTSASMRRDDLAAACAEIQGILTATGSGVRVICCDSRAAKAQSIVDARDVNLIGGGGTNMGAGLAAAEQLRPRPTVTIVLTDGFTPWPTHRPRNCGDVIVVIGEANSPDAPPWATTIRISTT